MKKLAIVIFIILIAIGAVIRLAWLGTLPLVLNRDEAALAVTARFIQATGADEHGHRWPLNTQSFGDWKLASYSYTLIPFLWLLGYQDWVVRLPSALTGIVMIAGVWILILELTKNLSSKADSLVDLDRYTLAGLAAFLLALSPWSIHVSRIAYEGHLAAGFGLFSVYFFVRAMRNSPWSAWQLVPATTLALLSMFTYHAFQVVMPLLGLGLLSMFRQKIWTNRESFSLPISISLSLVILAFGLLILDGLLGANAQKFVGISIFSAKNYQNSIIARWGSLPLYWGRGAHLYSNYFYELSLQIVRNIFSLIDMPFLFMNGGSEPMHRFSGAGLFHLYEVVTILTGFIICIRQRQKWQLLLLLWLCAALVPSIITLQPQHPIRLLGALVPLTCISALGFLTILKLVQRISRNVVRYVVTGLLASGILVSCVFTLITYFFYFNSQQYSTWPWYMREVVKAGELSTARPEIKHIVFQGTSLSPYIYFLWYGNYDFRTVASDITYYPPDESGFVHVAQLGSIKFEQIDWPVIENRGEHSVFIVRTTELPPDKLTDHRYDIQQEISHSRDKISYVVVVFKP